MYVLFFEARRETSTKTEKSYLVTIERARDNVFTVKRTETRKQPKWISGTVICDSRQAT